MRRDTHHAPESRTPWSRAGLSFFLSIFLPSTDKTTRLGVLFLVASCPRRVSRRREGISFQVKTTGTLYTTEQQKERKNGARAHACIQSASSSFVVFFCGAQGISPRGVDGARQHTKTFRRPRDGVVFRFASPRERERENEDVTEQNGVLPDRPRAIRWKMPECCC